MVDATDLKSVDFCDREGSSPSIPRSENCQFLKFLDFSFIEN